MQIHRIEGRDLPEALRRARQRHGDQALVLGHEPVPGGGVALSVVQGQRARAPEEGATASLDPGLAEVERRLLRHGCSRAWTSGVVQAAKRLGGRGAYAIDAAAAVVGRAVRAAPALRVERGRTRAIALVGPTGTGKTTCLARLASQLARARRRMALVSMDRRRAGAAAELRSLAQLLQCPFVVAGGPGVVAGGPGVVAGGPGVAAGGPGEATALADLLPRLRHADAILIDTPGCSPRDEEALAELGSSLEVSDAGTAPVAWLVLAAPTRRGDLVEATRAFAAVRPGAALVTMLDETRLRGAALEALARARLPIAFLTEGQAPSAGLHPASGRGFADLLLQGRLT